MDSCLFIEMGLWFNVEFIQDLTNVEYFGVRFGSGENEKLE